MTFVIIEYAVTCKYGETLLKKCAGRLWMSESCTVDAVSTNFKFAVLCTPGAVHKVSPEAWLTIKRLKYSIQIVFENPRSMDVDRDYNRLPNVRLPCHCSHQYIRASESEINPNFAKLRLSMFAAMKTTPIHRLLIDWKWVHCQSSGTSGRETAR
jgi:hypothetical protein